MLDGGERTLRHINRHGAGDRVIIAACTLVACAALRASANWLGSNGARYSRLHFCAAVVRCATRDWRFSKAPANEVVRPSARLDLRSQRTSAIMLVHSAIEPMGAVSAAGAKPCLLFAGIAGRVFFGGERHVTAQRLGLRGCIIAAGRRSASGWLLDGCAKKKLKNALGAGMGVLSGLRGSSLLLSEPRITSSDRRDAAGRGRAVFLGVCRPVPVRCDLWSLCRGSAFRLFLSPGVERGGCYSGSSGHSTTVPGMILRSAFRLSWDTTPSRRPLRRLHVMCNDRFGPLNTVSILPEQGP